MDIPLTLAETLIAVALWVYLFKCVDLLLHVWAASGIIANELSNGKYKVAYLLLLLILVPVVVILFAPKELLERKLKFFCLTSREEALEELISGLNKP